MRWLFLSLLVINIGYVSWELSRERPQSASRTALPRGVDPIVLLSERDGEGAQPEQAAQRTTADDASSASQPPAVAVSTPQDKLAQTRNELQSTVSLLDAATSESAAEIEAAETAPALDDSVQAFSAEMPREDICYTLGPFREMKTLRLVTREIKDYVVEASFRSKEEQEQTRFRVYVRPVGSKQAAQAVIRELISKGIKDHFIITEEPLKYAVSLGYFSSKNRAYRYADRVRNLGFDATAEPVFRSYTIYWLDYRIKAGSEIPTQIFNQHLEDETQKLRRSCG